MHTIWDSHTNETAIHLARYTGLMFVLSTTMIQHLIHSGSSSHVDWDAEAYPDNYCKRVNIGGFNLWRAGELK